MDTVFKANLKARHEKVTILELTFSGDGVAWSVAELR